MMRGTRDLLVGTVLKTELELRNIPGNGRSHGTLHASIATLEFKAQGELTGSVPSILGCLRRT
jgi:hypothetical protein